MTPTSKPSRETDAPCGSESSSTGTDGAGRSKRRFGRSSATSNSTNVAGAPSGASFATWRPGASESVAGVEPAGRHHGMHSLRHSAATNMLAGDVPYPVISGVLGHSNANTTRKYLAVDVERLRAMSLEVPRA